MQSDFVTICDAKEQGIIPELFHQYFPETCVYCKKPIYINYSKTVMKCCNPCCYRKVGMQLADLMHDLGYKGYGAETLTSYCIANEIKHITEFIADPPVTMNVAAELNSLRLTYPKLIEMLHIPHLGSKVHKLFQNCNSFRDFVNMIPDDEYAESAFFEHRAGGPTLGLEAREIIEAYARDLIDITKYVKVVPQAKAVILIAITGHLSFNGGCTKDAYIRFLNQQAEPLGMEFRRSDALQSVRFIVADAVSSSKKYRIGKARNNLITSTELYGGLKTLLDRRTNNG